MHILSWREVDFPSVVLAGLVAGYVMAIAGLWAGRVPGLVAIDIADYGRRYMVSDRPSAWVLGLASHLVNSVLLVLLWASTIVPNLAWPRLLVGLAWGEFLAVVLAGVLVAPLSGLGFMGRGTGDFRFVVTSLLLHAIWGVLVGALYVPR
jgi:hypothetical protein